MPALEEFYRAHRSEGFVLLAINAGESVEQVRSFIDAMGFTFPVLLDTRGEVLYSLGIRSFPTSVLVGRDGKVKKIHVETLTKAQLQREIAPALSRNCSLTDGWSLRKPGRPPEPLLPWPSRDEVWCASVHIAFLPKARRRFC